MLEQLEKNKRTISVAFLFATAVVLFAHYEKNEDAVLQAALFVLLLVCMQLSAFYFLKGIADAVMALFYDLMFLGSAAVSVILAYTVKLPPYLSGHFFLSAGVAILFLFTVAAPVPESARKIIEGRLEKILKKEAASVGNSSYDDYLVYQNTHQFKQRPFHISRVKTQAANNRIVAGLVFLAMGVYGIFLTLDYAEWSDPDYVLASWIGLVSAALFLLGSYIILLGFMRALLGASAFAAICAYVYLSVLLLEKSIRISLWIYGVMLLLLICLIIASLQLLVRYLLLRHQPRLVSYEKSGLIYAADPLLIDRCPIRNYGHLLLAVIRYEPGIRSKDFDFFNARCALFCQESRILFVGAVLDKERCVYTLYIYYNKIRKQKKVRRFLDHYVKSPYEILCEKDPEYTIYKTKLYPDELSILRIQNMSLIYELGKTDFNFDEPASLLFFASFADREKALAFEAHFQEQEREGVLFLDETGNALYAGADPTKSEPEMNFHVIVQKNMRLSLERLDIETIGFHKIAKDYGGVFIHFNFGEIKREAVPEEQAARDESADVSSR